MEIESNNLKTLLRSPFLHQVELGKTLLSQHGIQSFVFDRNLDIIIGTSVSEGYRLSVALNDFEKAKEILQNSNKKTD
jgi:hypothetical protein